MWLFNESNVFYPMHDISSGVRRMFFQSVGVGFKHCIPHAMIDASDPKGVVLRGGGGNYSVSGIGLHKG